MEKQELMKLWQVEFQNLTEPEVVGLSQLYFFNLNFILFIELWGEIAPNIRKCSDTVNFQKKKAESHRSLQSGFESNTSTTVDVNLRTSGYTPYLYHNELVLAKQHSPLHRLTKSHIRFMTQVWSEDQMINFRITLQHTVEHLFTLDPKSLPSKAEGATTVRLQQRM